MARQVLSKQLTFLLADVGAPTVTPQGTTGAVTYDYKVVAVNENGEKTLVSSAGQTTTGNATLGLINFNRVTWTAPWAGD